MRSWFVIKNGVEHRCEFTSINVLKRILWLKIGTKRFKVTFFKIGDYEYAKRGQIIRADASNKKQDKSIEIIFK